MQCFLITGDRITHYFYVEVLNKEAVSGLLNLFYVLVELI